MQLCMLTLIASLTLVLVHGTCHINLPLQDGRLILPATVEKAVHGEELTPTKSKVHVPTF